MNLDVRQFFTPDGEVIPPHKLSDHAARQIQSIKQNADGTWEYRFCDRLKAMEVLMGYMGVKNLDISRIPVDVLKEWLIERMKEEGQVIDV